MKKTPFLVASFEPMKRFLVRSFDLSAFFSWTSRARIASNELALTAALISSSDLLISRNSRTLVS